MSSLTPATATQPMVATATICADVACSDHHPRCAGTRTEMTTAAVTMLRTRNHRATAVTQSEEVTSTTYTGRAGGGNRAAHPRLGKSPFGLTVELSACEIHPTTTYDGANEPGRQPPPESSNVNELPLRIPRRASDVATTCSTRSVCAGNNPLRRPGPLAVQSKLNRGSAR